MKSFQTQTHYEVLEISVSATSADVKSAYERLSNLYSDDQVVLYGLIDASMASALRGRLKEAFEVLVDEDRRDGYDAKIGLPPRGPPKPKTVAAQVKAPVSAPTWGSYTFVSSASVPPPVTAGAYTYVVPAPSYAAPTAPMAPVVKRAPAPETVRPPPTEGEAESKPVGSLPQVGVVAKEHGAAVPEAPVRPPEVSVVSSQPSVASPQSSVASPQSSVVSPQSSVVSPLPSVVSPQPSPETHQPTLTPPQPQGSVLPARLELVAHADVPTLEAVVETDLVVVISAPAPTLVVAAPVEVAPSSVVGEPSPTLTPPVVVQPVEAVTSPTPPASAPTLVQPATPTALVAQPVEAVAIPTPPASAPASVQSAVPTALVAQPVEAVAIPTPTASAPTLIQAAAPTQPVEAVATPAPPASAPTLVQAAVVAQPVEAATIPAPPASTPKPPPASPPKPEPRVDTTPTFAPISDDSAIITVRAAVSREFRPEPRPRPYEIPEGVEINGDLLRQVRLARGLTLAQLADRTRIGTKHLENVEGDRYDALPVGVYLRGILMNLARELGLDGLRVARSYLTFVDAHRSKG